VGSGEIQQHTLGEVGINRYSSVVSGFPEAHGLRRGLYFSAFRIAEKELLWAGGLMLDACA
jgi:hypothetical protein